MPEAYGQALRYALERSGISLRRLSVLLAERTGNKPDSERRALTKYQAGDEAPDQERAALLAELLTAPELAEVAPVQERRQRRLRGLVEAVDRLERVVEDLTGRVEALERRVGDESPQRARRR
jgi:transcriptional regulator with XRE-family HTH domain